MRNGREQHGEGKYMISIIGEQNLYGESDRVELLTDGNYIMKNGHSYIGYKEYDDSDGADCCDNLIKVEDDTVTITRKGAMQSRLILQKGRRHQCYYQTPAGELIIGVYTKAMHSTLAKNGGRLEVSYTLDFNTDLVSENSFTITVEQKNNGNEAV